MNYIVKQLLHVKNIIKLFERKNRKTLTKHITQQNHFVIAKFRILKCLKRIKKIQEVPFCGKFVSEVQIFAVANIFFS